MIGCVRLLPRLGDVRLDAISTEGVQQLKAYLGTRAPKTVTNVLTVLNTMLKKAVE
jgi:mRNA-degrading endonuclease toxin of MazEF toxin-antitoxin module